MDRIGSQASEFAQVPTTLHGQLFLLAFDPKRGRFDGYDVTLFGYALRAAMLADLYLAGYLVERDGWAVPGRAASPDNLVLRATFAQVGVHNRTTWAQLVAGNAHEAISAVREQLLTEGWLRAGRGAVRAVPVANLEPYDPCRVGVLADAVGGALNDTIAGLPADPYLLAVGLLAVLAQLPGVADVVADADPDRLQELMRGAIAPIPGLTEAIKGRPTW
ncbi:GPP34 family phosphoprotein [Mycolicibacterium sp. Dal123E01]|uniref:GPP34 family phosphoprotein n=1 Tax=Mycolicibacterium sp. Dal123E01 TaxID=3457578 RepID=UPI00403EF16B